MSDKFDNVSVGKKPTYSSMASACRTRYFSGRHPQTVGVIMPGSQLTFNVSTPN